MSTTSGCRDTQIQKIEFVARTHLLCVILSIHKPSLRSYDQTLWARTFSRFNVWWIQTVRQAHNIYIDIDHIYPLVYSWFME